MNAKEIIEHFDATTSRISVEIKDVREGLTSEIKDVREKVEDIGRATAAETTQAANDRNKLNELHYTVKGNGKPGLEKEMAEAKASLSRIRWSFTTVIVPLIIYAGYLWLQKMIAPK